MKHLRLLTMAVFALFVGMTASAQRDITDQYLQNADLSTVDNGWTYFSDAYKYQQWREGSTETMTPAVEFYAGWGSLEHKDFKFSQTVTLPAGDYRIAVNAFFREGNDGDGTNAGKAWIFAGETKQNVVGLNKGGLNQWSSAGDDMDRARAAFKSGAFSNEFDFSLDAETAIELGFQGKFDNIRQWCILGPVKLLQYSLEDYLVDYRKWVAEAQALYNSPMNATVLANLKAAVVSERDLKTSKAVTTAINNLKEKIAEAQQSIADYAATKAAFDEYDEKSNELDRAGKAAYDEAVNKIKNAYNNRTMEGDQTEAVKAAFNTGYVSQESVTDITSIAPTDWVYGQRPYAGRTERYDTNTYIGDVMYQQLAGMPAGTYEIVLEASASYTSGRGFDGKAGYDLTVVFANEQTTDIEVVDRESTDDFGPYTVIGKVGADGILKYGLKNIAEGGNWFVINLVSIKKVAYVPVTSITAADIEVEVLGTKEIGATVAPTNATLPKITYTSGDESIATVDKNGVVTGAAEGNTTITLKADEITKTIKVTVTPPAILPKSITLNPNKIDFKLGENTTATITAQVLPAEANQEVTFTSSDESIATVDANGNVTATGIGSATITVTSKSKEDVKATATVTVSAADAPEYYEDEIADGREFWIMNAATGKYLGGANNWGTRASIIEHGIPFMAIEAGEGIYKLDSYTNNGGDSHFLAIADGAPWIDQPATEIQLIPNSNGSFCLKIGDNYLKANGGNTLVDWTTADAKDPFAQWYFLSKTNRISMLEEGLDNDATFFIKDYNFSRNNTQYADWKFEASNKDNAGDASNYCVESYRALFNMSQTLGLPNGTYKLTAQGFYRVESEGEGDLPVFFANDQEKEFILREGTENSMTEASNSFSIGKYKIEPITVVVTDHTLKIGAKNDSRTNLWCIWDNFELEAVSLDQDDEEIVPVTIGETGYATLYYSNLNLMTTDVTPCTITVEGHTATPTPLEKQKGAAFDDSDAYIIPAGTPVLLQGAPGKYNFDIATYENLSKAFAIGENQLKGTDEDEEITVADNDNNRYFILNTLNNVVGFYFGGPNGGTFTNKAHKAYLPVKKEQSEGVNVYVLNLPDEITSIQRSTEDTNAPAYNLAGQRVNSSYNGVVIVNGKKYFRK